MQLAIKHFLHTQKRNRKKLNSKTIAMSVNTIQKKFTRTDASFMSAAKY